MKKCGECTECCTWLQGDAYGHKFGGGISCKFLECSGCSVHVARPKSCRNYYCAWAQELLDEEMRPDKCGVIASVEKYNDVQCLKLTAIKFPINNEVLEYFKNWGNLMNVPVLYLKDNVWEIV